MIIFPVTIHPFGAALSFSALRAQLAWLADIQRRKHTEKAIIGWPKCGNTWLSALLRFSILKAYHLPEERLPGLFTTDFGGFSVFRIPAYATIAHTHALPNPRSPSLSGVADSLHAFDDKDVIVLIRDFRDMIVSSYMHEVYRAPQARFAGDPDRFAEDPAYGLPRIVGYYDLIADIRAEQSGSTKLVQYEDLWQDTKSTLADILLFLRIDFDEEGLQFAISNASFSNMRAMESAATQSSAKIPGLFRSVNDGENARKVRRGGVGNWREDLSPETGGRLFEAYNKTLATLSRVADRA